MAELEITKTSGKVRLAGPGGFEVPRRVSVAIYGEAADEHLPFVGKAELRFQGGRLEVVSLTLRQMEGGPPVGGELLRAIPLAIVRWVVQRVVTGVAPTDESDPPVALMASMASLTKSPREVAAAGLSDEALALTASIYRRALVSGDPPARAVHKSLGIPRSTAGRWIMLARRRGFLGDAPEQRKAGEENA